MTFTIKSLDELAGHFAQKSREMNDIAQQRVGLVKHNYAGQAHAYNDVAITIRNCQIATKGKRNVKQHNNPNSAEHERQHTSAGGGQSLSPKD